MKNKITKKDVIKLMKVHDKVNKKFSKNLVDNEEIDIFLTLTYLVFYLIYLTFYLT